MRFGVGRVHKLSGNKAVGDLRRKFFRLCNRALHPLCTLGEHQLCAVGFQKITAFHRHRFGHYDDNSVSTRRSNRRKADTGISGSWLDNHRTGFQFSTCFSLIDHFLRDPVFHRTCRVPVFQFGNDLCFQVQSLFNMCQFQKRGFSDQLVCRCINVRHKCYLQVYLIHLQCQSHTARQISLIYITYRSTVCGRWPDKLQATKHRHIRSKRKFSLTSIS